jgi:uncharacterized membrane protein YjgN (DUF898 family)
VPHIAQRTLLVAALVAIVVLGGRIVPQSMGLLPRIVLLTCLVVVALWLISRTIRWRQAREVTRRR